MPIRLFKRTLVACFSIALSSFAIAQGEIDLDAPLTPDPAIRIGTLENGFKYYLKHNTRPENRAVIRLVVNVGSLQEEDEQRGIAHFVEHLAFNGTERFAKHEIVDFIEKIGMRFGADLNATTSYNETIYKLQVPLDDESVTDKAFMIVRDWADGILFEEEEIEKERGVILEEWRARKGLRMRMMEAQIPYLYHDSKYAERLTIGTPETIRSVSREDFLNFYQKWYRPDTMAFIAVGDFDVDAFEERVKETFSGLQAPPESTDRGTYPIPDHEGTMYSIETDPELRSASLNVLIKRPFPEQATAGAMRKSLVERLYLSMINARLSERAKEAKPPFAGAGVGVGVLGREKGYFSLGLGFIGDRYEEGVTAVMQEIERARREGFTETEFERSLANEFRGLERLFEERDKRESPTFASELTRSFLIGESTMGIEREVALVRRLYETISLPEVNAVGDALLEDDNRVALFTAPEQDELEPPSPDDIASFLQLEPSEHLESYDDGVSDDPLLAELPEPGTVKEEIYHEEIDTQEWILSNGIRVFLKSTDFKNDEIIMKSFSPGGTSLVSDDDFEESRIAIQLVNQSGLGDYDAVQLRKKLAGKAMQVSIGFDGMYELGGGSTSLKDMETFFQLLYMQFVHPRLDLDAFASVKARIRTSLENRLKSPFAVWNDEVEQVLFQNHFRHQPPTIEKLESIDPQVAFDVYRDRFAEAGDFTFVFVGNIDLDTIRPFIERYVASLPTIGREEEGRFIGDNRAKGHLEVTTDKNVEDKTVVRVMYYGDATWSAEENLIFGMTREVLNIRLRESLREEQGKVYGARVSGGIGRIPIQEFTSTISFTSEPGSADEVIELALDEIKKLQSEGPLVEDLEKVKESRHRSYEKGLKENGFWLNAIISYLKTGRDFSELLEYDERVDAVTSEDIKRAAQHYFDDTNRLIAKLNPASAKNAAD